MSASPQELIRPEVLALSVYQVPDAAGMVKLDAMENPYRLAEALQDEIAQLCRCAQINRYPDAHASLLKARLRTTMAIPAGAGVLVGNGSDEIIQIVEMCVAKPGAVIMGVEPSFVMFRVIAASVGAKYVGVPLKADFSLDAQAMREALATHRPALVFLAYPNNPTGICLTAMRYRVS